MVKYKFTIIWVILFIIAISIAAITISGSPDPEQDKYNPGIIMGAILVLVCCPTFIFDYRNTDKFKNKQEEKKLKLELQKKQIELEIKEQDLDFEKRKMVIEQEKAKLIELKQIAGKQGLTKVCDYCGKEIEGDASICPYCGNELMLKED